MTSIGYKTIDNFTYLVVSGYITNPVNLNENKFIAYVVKHTDLLDLKKIFIEVKYNLEYPALGKYFGPLLGSKFEIVENKLTITSNKRVLRHDLMTNDLKIDFSKLPDVDSFLSCTNYPNDSYPILMSESSEFVLIRYAKNSDSRFDGRAIGLISKKTLETFCLKDHIHHFALLRANSKASSLRNISETDLILSSKMTGKVNIYRLEDHLSLTIDSSNLVNPVGEYASEKELTI